MTPKGPPSHCSRLVIPPNEDDPDYLRSVAFYAWRMSPVVAAVLAAQYPIWKAVAA